MKKISVALVDDHHILLDGLKALLGKQPGIYIVGAYTNGKDLLHHLDNLLPDVVVADINMPELNGIELTKAIKQRSSTAVLCLSMHDDIGHIMDMTDAGASGYLLKNANDAELIDAIKTIAGGGLYFPQEILAKMNADRDRRSKAEAGMPGTRLTARELDILRLIAKEYNNAKIAETLFISERTVETHRKNMLRKTNYSTMLGLLKFAVEHNML